MVGLDEVLDGGMVWIGLRDKISVMVKMDLDRVRVGMDGVECIKFGNGNEYSWDVGGMVC